MLYVSKHILYSVVHFSTPILLPHQLKFKSIPQSSSVSFPALWKFCLSLFFTPDSSVLAVFHILFNSGFHFSERCLLKWIVIKVTAPPFLTLVSPSEIIPPQYPAFFQHPFSYESYRIPYVPQHSSTIVVLLKSSSISPTRPLCPFVRGLPALSPPLPL